MRMSAHAVRGEGKFQMVKKKTKMRLPRESQRLRTFSTIACSTILAFMAVVGGKKAPPPPPPKKTPLLYYKTKKKKTPPHNTFFLTRTPSPPPAAPKDAPH